ncbi:probable indole-3-pyruvate monooxygenase YUCCA10 [Tanacetum coccineum]
MNSRKKWHCGSNDECKWFFLLQILLVNRNGWCFENDPLMIRNVSIILKKWLLNCNPLKEEPNSLHVWVKMHDIPVYTFTEDCLSVMATKLGKSMMIDAYMSSMCMQSWGRLNFVRALIDLRADRALKSSMVIAKPTLEGVVADFGKQNSKASDEFVNALQKAFRGLHVGGLKFRHTNPTKQYYRPVAKKDKGSTSGTKKSFKVISDKTATSNPFDAALNSVESDDILGSNRVGKSSDVIDEESESDVEHDHDKIMSFMAPKSGGALEGKVIREPYQPPKGLWSGERVRGSELPPNEIPVGVEKAKAGFPSECSPVTRERSLSITGVPVYCDPTSELEGPSPQRRS